MIGEWEAKLKREEGEEGEIRSGSNLGMRLKSFTKNSYMVLWESLPFFFLHQHSAETSCRLSS